MRLHAPRAVTATLLALAACSGNGGQDSQSEFDPADSDYKVAVMDDRFDDAVLANLLDQFPDCLATDSIVVRSPSTDEITLAAERGVAAGATIGVDCQSASGPTETIVGACQGGEWVAYDDGAWTDIGTPC